MTKFISMSGKKGSGKDTAATELKWLLEDRDLRVVITHFAAPIKKMGAEIFGIPYEISYGSNEDKETLCDVLWEGLPMAVRQKYGTTDPLEMGPMKMPRTGRMTVREFLQVMGTDIFRERVYGNVWAEAPFKREWEADVVIIADCRFPNEVESTLRGCGHIIRLLRDTGLEEDEHPSETALDHFNWNRAGCEVYDNNGTIERLREYLRGWAARSGF